MLLEECHDMAGWTWNSGFCNVAESSVISQVWAGLPFQPFSGIVMHTFQFAHWLESVVLQHSECNFPDQRIGAAVLGVFLDELCYSQNCVML
jgi:hypothetical protein